MSTRTLLTLVMCAAALLAACTGPAAVDTRAEAETIRTLGHEWNAAVKAHDLEKALSFYAPDAVEMPTNAPIIIGREAIRHWFESWIADTTILNEFTTEVVDVAASGDIAVERGTYRFGQTTPKGQIEDVGKYILVWRKIDGVWKAAADISNRDQPRE
jgi:uncharacterized protein (TIGR02246 family)